VEFSLCWFLFAFLLVVMLMCVSEGGEEVERFSGGERGLKTVTAGGIVETVVEAREGGMV